MDVIMLDELSDMISELNSSLGSDIDTINSNVDEVKATVNAINTATAVNNTASTTGTLSQKLSSIYNQIGATSSSGGSTSAGNVMAKLNKLLDIVSGKYVTKTATQSSMTSDTTFISLSNIILIRAEIACKGYDADYYSKVYLDVDGIQVSSNTTTGSSYSYVYLGTEISGDGISANLPCYCNSLTVRGYGQSSSSSRNSQKATIYYIQL